MEVNEKEAGSKYVYKGKTFYFCTPRCKETFSTSPEKYLTKLEGDALVERKVVIVGTGGVGATFAFNLMISGLANSIVLIDLAREVAEGHVMDLQHGLSFLPPSQIYVGDFSDCRDADIVVITAGAHMKPGESRIDLVRKNVAIFKELIPQIVQYNPRILLIVSNPVDILTCVTQKLSGYPMNRVIGSGTVLDTSRFKYLLAQKCGVDPRNVHGYIIGEHGDSEVPVWSEVNIGGVPIDDFLDHNARESQSVKEQIFNQVKNAAYEIINRKGGTNFAVSLAIMQIVTSILRDENRILTVSTLLHDYYAIHDVCMSIPTILNRNGISRTIKIKLDESERAKLSSSAKVLEDVFKSLDFD
ncbi:MAG: L-lactate dehydrogenase [Calditrichaeota bacterium]|nr:L-lactate dehydrogenase [Calditrichota bacterium]